MKLYHAFLSLLVVAVFSSSPARAQNIAWTGPTGITGDANLDTNGSSFDALILNTSASSGLSADGITFNVAASRGGSVYGDGTINYTGSGLNDFSWAGSF